MHNLETFVSTWHKKHGQDLRWVIRKPGIKWFVDTEVLDQWLKTSEGEKAPGARPEQKRKG